MGPQEGARCIKVAARPVDGSANTRLITFLARHLLRIPRSSVRITRGERARHKQLEIDLAADELVRRLRLHLRE